MFCTRQVNNKINHQLGAQFEEIKEAYDKLMKQYEYNRLIYEAKFNFEPIVSQVYHL